MDLPHRQTQLNFTQNLGSHKVDGAKTVTSSAKDRTLKQEKKMVVVSNLQGIPTHQSMSYSKSICKNKGAKL